MMFALVAAVPALRSVILFRAMTSREQSKKKSGRVAIKRARGVLKRRPGEKPFRQWWAEYKKEEKALEEEKFTRLRPR